MRTWMTAMSKTRWDSVANVLSTPKTFRQPVEVVRVVWPCTTAGCTGHLETQPNQHFAPFVHQCPVCQTTALAMDQHPRIEYEVIQSPL